MATRTSKVKEPKEGETSKTAATSSEYVELKLPKLPVQTRSLLIPLLVLALIIGAYFLGVQTTKVKYLEEQATGTQAGSAINDPNTPQPSPAPIVMEVETGHLPIMGDEDAPVTMVEFSDFQCPFCKRFTDEAFQKIKEEYIDTGKVKYAFRHYPLPSHPNSSKAAEASECANEQGSFWEYHDVLFENQNEWSPLSPTEAQNTFVTYAGNVELNTGQFESCLTSGKYAEAVEEDTQAAQAAQVTATPTAYINGQQVVGALPFDAFKTIFDEQLN